MAQKSVFNRPSAKEVHDRNPFDWSYVNNFNFSAGMLIPTFYSFVFGHSHFRINQRCFLRTNALNTAAFPRLPFYTDYFYVPMHVLISNWNEFRSVTNDPKSSRLAIPARIPTFSINALRTALSNNYYTSDELGYDKYRGMIRILDLFNYGVNKSVFLGVDDPSRVGIPAMGDMHPLMACAYQACYYSHFRNTQYSSNNIQAYNLDQFYRSNPGQIAVPPENVSADVLSDMLTLHYVNYRRDYFNTIYPSLNFISQGLSFNRAVLPSNIVGFPSFQFLNNVDISKPHAVSGDGGRVMLGTEVYASQGDSDLEVTAPISLQNIRAAYALERLLRVSAFAPQHTVDQFEARFGYRPKSAEINEVRRLGSFSTDIVIGEVTSTADTRDSASAPFDGRQLGAIGGKGVGASGNGKTIKFDVPEDGIIIGISYVLPRLTYDSYRVDPIHQLFTPEDWSLPEYEKMGLQPIIGRTLSVGFDSEKQDSELLAIQNAILGYQPRDMQFKAKVNQNHGLLNRGESGSTGVANSLEYFVTHGRRNWMDLISEQGLRGLNSGYFKCDPRDLNDIFVEAFDGSEDTDQFFGQIIHECSCIMDKPVFGVPAV